MRTFDYFRPASLDEAITALTESDGRARPLAGGTDLLVQLRAKRYALDCVVDVKAVPELAGLRYRPTEGLTIGAAVPCCRIYEDVAISTAYPALADAVSILGGIAIQGRATVGGNLCNASPSADAVPALMVLGARCTIGGPAGVRTMAIGDFCTGPGTNVLQPAELLISLDLPPAGGRTGSQYLRFIPRQEMDIAVVGVGARVALAEDGRTVEDARLALGAVAPTAIEVAGAQALLAGTEGDEDVLEAVALAAREAARPISDMRGSAEQRRHLVGVLTKRALRAALERARGATSR